jgi:hypothetical protein
MTSKDCASELISVAGGFDALTETQAPCAKDCAAHPIQVQKDKLHARAYRAIGTLLGNGGVDEVAEAVVRKLDGKRTPSVSDGATPWAWFVAAYKTNPVMRNAVTLAAISLLTMVPTCASRGVKDLAIAAVKQANVAANTAQKAAAKAAVTSSNVNEIVSLLEFP